MIQRCTSSSSSMSSPVSISSVDLSKHRRRRSALRGATSGVVLASAFAAAALALVAPSSARAQEAQWDNDGIDAPSGGPGQWDSVTPRWLITSDYEPWPGQDDAILGGAGGAVQIQEDTFVSSLRFDAPNYAITVPTTLTGGGTTPSLIFSGTGVIDTGANDADVFARIGGASDLVKRGTGTLVFHGGNTFTGNTVIEAGTLALGNTLVADLPTTTNITINQGATLSLAPFGGAFTDTVGAITGEGNIVLGGSPGFGNATGSHLTIQDHGIDGVISGNITGDGGRLTKSGAGTLKLSGNAPGMVHTRVFGGVLELEGGNAIHDQAIVSVQIGTIPAGDPTWADATLRLVGDETIGGLTSSAGANRIVDLGTHTLTLGANDQNIEFSGKVTGAGRIVKVGTGTQTFQTNVSDFTGGITVKGGLFLGALDNRYGAVPESFTPANITLDGGGIGNGPTSGYTLDSNRGILVTENNGQIYVASSQAGASTNITYSGVIDGPGRVTKIGGGTLTIGGDNTHAGGWDVTDGGLIVAKGTGEPLGPGAVRVAGATLGFAPAPGSVPVDSAVTVAGGEGSALTYGNGAILSVSRHFENSITVTIGGGPTPPAGGPLVREGNGTLVINYANALGDPGAERVLVSGGGPAITNGIVTPTIIGARASDGHGDFLTYDGIDGFKTATYTATDLNTAGPTSVVNVTTPQNMGGDRTVYALRLEGDFRTGLGGTLTVGAAGGPSTVIMNGGFMDGGTLALPGDGIIHSSVRGFPSEIGSRITGAGGITKTGDGELVLGNDANTFTGGLRVTAGTLTAGVDNVIPASNDVTLSGTGTLYLRGTNQRIGSLSGSYRSVVNLEGGTLTVGAGDGQHRGRVIGGGTLAKDGAGVLILGEERHMASKPSGTNSYGKLAISGGGTVAVSSIVSLPENPAALTPDTITLDNGTLRIASENYSVLGQFIVASTIGGGSSFNRGITVGPGGGTVDVVNPYEIVLWQRGNAAANAAVLLNGSGTFTKTGAGIFRLGPGNEGDPAVAGDGFTGKFRVMGGNLQFQEGGSLGEAPATLVPDQFQIGDGGMIQSNGFGQIEATRGTTLLGGEALFNTATGSFTFNGPITGPGGITKVGSTSTTAINLAAANDFQGDLKLLNGRVNLNASNAAGQGAIVLKPEYPVILGKSAGADDSVIANDITAHAGSSISLQVDGTSTGRLVLNGNVGGDAKRVFKTGVGNLVLGGNGSTFGGDIVVQQGTLTVAGANALGAAGTGGNTVVNPGATLAFDANHTGAETVYIAGTGVADAGAIANIAAETFAGSVVATQNASISSGSSNFTIAGGLRIGRGSTLVRTGHALLASGPVVIGPGAIYSLQDGDTHMKNVRGNRLEILSGNAAITPDGTDAGTSVLNDLTISGTPGAWAHELDLSNNDLIVRADDPAERDAKLATIEDMVTTARNSGTGGRWTGKGITSSAARANSLTGLAVAANFGLTTFSGQSVGPDDVLVKYTYNGDANLDGRINADDYFRIDQGFLSQPADPHYRDGDFNDDGTVNADDYFLIDQAFLGQGEPLDGFGGALAAVAVPEPGTLTLVALGAAGLLARRRRR